jgi:hypothetical protein
MNKEVAMKHKLLILLPVTLVTLFLGVSLCLVDGARANLAPPERLAVFPPPESHTAGVTTPISITYDQDMDPLTVNPQTFAVHARQTGWLTGTLSVSGGTIRLDPLSPLHAGELVQVTATTQTLSLGGEGPITPTVWQFTTAPWSGNAYFHLVQSWEDAASNANALGDLDGDGDLDTVTANGWGIINVLHNDGSANFMQVQQISIPGAPINMDVDLGDLDGDGDLDAFLTSLDYVNPDRFLFNNGDGTFTLGSQTVPAYEDTYAELGDLDGDGDLDILVASGGFGTSTIRTWMNDGTGNFTLGVDFDDDYEHTGIALGDLDGDSDLDAFSAGWNFTYDKVWLNDGTGAFIEHQSIPTANTLTPLLGDLDGDGDLDVYLANEAFDLTNLPDQVWLNDGNGSFHNTRQVLYTAHGVIPALGDLDADSDLDVYISGLEPGPDEVWLNDGLGNFNLGYRTNENLNGALAVLGDLDGDGDLDAVTLDNVDNHNVFLNGGWVPTEPIPHPLALSAHVQCVDDPNSLYVIGGADGYGSPTNLVYRYDVLEDSWTQLADMPGLDWLPTGVCVDDKIYVQWSSTNLLIYDIATDTWSEEAGVPRITEGAALGAWGGNLYLVGGGSSFTYEATDEVDIYDITNHAWHIAAGMPMPQATDYAGVVQVGQYLYIVGGMSYIYEEVYLVQRYDMATDSWLTADYESGFVFPALTATGEYLYAMGGDPPGDEQWTSSDLVQRLRLDEWLGGAWEDIHVPLPKISFGASSFCTDALTGGEIWHIGGGDGATGIVYTDTLYLPAEPCVGYGVDLLTPEGGRGEIGGSVKYVLTITNTGTITDYFGVDVETTWPEGATHLQGALHLSLGGPGLVGPGESITVTISVDIPEDAMPGEEGVSSITVESLRDPSIATLGEITTLVLGYGVTVTPESAELLGAAGETLEYTLTVTNTGTFSDTFVIAVSGNTWTTTAPVSTGWLEPGEEVEIPVTVTIPFDAPPGAEDVALLLFSSVGDPEVSANATLTSRTYTYGLEVSPESAEGWGKAGETLTYTLVVTNTGQAGDWYSIVLSGNLWMTEAPTQTVWLESGVTTTVEVVVSIPLEALAGEWDVAVLTITSQQDPDQFAVVTLTSRVPVWFTYLPMITK